MLQHLSSLDIKEKTGRGKSSALIDLLAGASVRGLDRPRTFAAEIAVRNFSGIRGRPGRLNVEIAEFADRRLGCL